MGGSDATQNRPEGPPNPQFLNVFITAAHGDQWHQWQFGIACSGNSELLALGFVASGDITISRGLGAGHWGPTSNGLCRYKCGSAWLRTSDTSRPDKQVACSALGPLGATRRAQMAKCPPLGQHKARGC